MKKIALFAVIAVITLTVLGCGTAAPATISAVTNQAVQPTVSAVTNQAVQPTASAVTNQAVQPTASTTSVQPSMNGITYLSLTSHELCNYGFNYDGKNITVEATVDSITSNTEIEAWLGAGPIVYDCTIDVIFTNPMHLMPEDKIALYGVWSGQSDLDYQLNNALYTNP